MKKLVVAADMLKAHIDQYVRKDGVVVQAHDDKRHAAAPKPAASGHSTSTLNVLADQHAAESVRHDKLATKKGVGHPDYDHHVDASSMHSRLQYHAEHARDAADGSAERASHLAEHARIKSKVEAVEAKIGASGASAQKSAAGGYVAPKEGEVGHHEHTEYGTYFRKGDKVKDQTGKTHEVAEHRGASVRTTNGEMFHPTKLKHAAEPRLALPVKKASAQAKAALYDKDQSGLGPHKVGDTVSYKGERGSTRTGKVKGSRDGKVVVEHKAGYTEMKHHSELSPAATKTGSAAPAKTVNIGTAKYPLHAKTSEKLPAKHGDGSTHHVGGFKAPDYPENGGGTNGDVMVHHDGKTYSHTGKKGKNTKTGEDSFEYANKDDGESRVWVTRSGHLMND